MFRAICVAIAASIFAFVLSSGPAKACSVPHVKSGAEITQAADVILRVKVPDKEVSEIAPIDMTVLEILKGKFKSKTVTVRGQTAKYYGANEKPVPYDFVRRGGRHGNCYAFDYRRNGQFLLFLSNGMVHWAALAATNEEVSGKNDPWVWWVKGFLAATNVETPTIPKE